MIVAITPKQWSGLVEALSLAEGSPRSKAELGVSFAADEGARFVHRERLFPLVEVAIGGRTAIANWRAPGQPARRAGALSRVARSRWPMMIASPG